MRWRSSARPARPWRVKPKCPGTGVVAGTGPNCSWIARAGIRADSPASSRGTVPVPHFTLTMPAPTTPGSTCVPTTQAWTYISATAPRCWWEVGWRHWQGVGPPCHPHVPHPLLSPAPYVLLQHPPSQPPPALYPSTPASPPPLALLHPLAPLHPWLPSAPPSHLPGPCPPQPPLHPLSFLQTAGWAGAG